MNRIWLINCFMSDTLAADLSAAFRRGVGRAGSVVETRMRDLPVPVPDGATHLVLSGSEASVLEAHRWNRALADTVRRWIDGKRPLLGICYGHQFLAATLAGAACVRRAATPEFGWTTIRTRPFPLVPTDSSLTAMVSHYDEVVNLPADFTVPASSERCGVHAFQYRKLPVFGIQFHPEYGSSEAEVIFHRLRESNPDAMKWFLAPEEPHHVPEAGVPEILQRFVRLTASG